MITIQTLLLKKRTSCFFYYLHSLLFYFSFLSITIFLVVNKNGIFQDQDYQSLFHYFSIENYIFEWFKPAISYDVLGVLGIVLSIGSFLLLFKKKYYKKVFDFFGFMYNSILDLIPSSIHRNFKNCYWQSIQLLSYFLWCSILGSSFNICIIFIFLLYRNMEFLESSIGSEKILHTSISLFF